MSLRDRCLRPLGVNGQAGCFYSLDALAETGLPGIRRLPFTLRIVLESLLRNCDGTRVLEQDVRDLANWQPNAARTQEIPFVVGRIVLQDVAGIPLLGDLAALRGAAARTGRPLESVRPRVPVDMVIDHAIEVDVSGVPGARKHNEQREFEQNGERFGFVKWAMREIDGIRLIPPGFGILHQVNLEYLSTGLLRDGDVYFPDSLVGTDSHTCMISGLGVMGWGVGGIEAQAAMLGEPVGFLAPDVVGVRLVGSLRPGVTATDLVLHLTQILRAAGVVGQFVEFIGEGVAGLTVPDRATIANMAPEYGATVGFFPFDRQSVRYLTETGRGPQAIADLERYLTLQGCFGDPAERDVRYTRYVDVDLGDMGPSVAGPRRPQDRVDLRDVKQVFRRVVQTPAGQGGYGRGEPCWRQDKDADGTYQPRDGDILIAAITSCTNTSNPSVMLAAGLIADAAVKRGMVVRPWVKTSMSPGSRAVTAYLERTNLQRSLDALGFQVAGYGCMTCVGNSGPLDAEAMDMLRASGVVGCAVLSGNRNFEARIHPALRASWLASPPLVVAYALAGTVDIDLASDPLGIDQAGQPVFLAELWPDDATLASMLASVTDPQAYREIYVNQLGQGSSRWDRLPDIPGRLYPWDAGSTFIQEPPYFTDPALGRSPLEDFGGGRALLILGDSVTTDHISPIGPIDADSPAGRYLRDSGVPADALGSYGARRMNHEVMIRGGFGNIRLRNLMIPGGEGPWTLFHPGGKRMPLFDAAMRYRQAGVPLVVFAGHDYGTGSARDWAAKATRMLGVKAVIASSFERIHRSNLAGMGVLPCQLPADVSIASLDLDGSETFALSGLSMKLEPRSELRLSILRAGGGRLEVPVVLRLDTRTEIEYARHGGILRYLLERI